MKTFFIGTDYKNIGQLRSEIVTTNNQINQLKTLLEKVSDTASKTEIEKQIQFYLLLYQKISSLFKAS